MAWTASPTRPRSDLVPGITAAELDPDTQPLSEVWYSSTDGTQAHRRSARTSPPPIPATLSLAGTQLTRCSDHTGDFRSVSTYPASPTMPRCLGCKS